MSAAAIALDALENIALAGMSPSPEMSEEAVTEWHARQAWNFISIAARALEPLRAAIKAEAVQTEPWGYWWEPKYPTCTWLHAGKSSNTGPHPDYNVTALYSTPQQPAPGWQPIETAPKDGTEILGYREDAGVFMIRYTSLDAFLSEKEIEQYEEEILFAKDWFCADFMQGDRLEGSEIPTHWIPLPAAPKATS